MSRKWYRDEDITLLNALRAGVHYRDVEAPYEHKFIMDAWARELTESFKRDAELFRELVRYEA